MELSHIVDNILSLKALLELKILQFNCCSLAFVVDRLLPSFYVCLHLTA